MQELDAGLQVGSHQSGVKGENHLPQTPGHASFGGAQDIIVFLGCKCTLLTCVQFFLYQYPQVCFCSAALNTVITQSVLVLVIDLTHV